MARKKSGYLHLCSAASTVGIGEDQKSDDGSMIVGREFTAANAHRRRLERRRRLLAMVGGDLGGDDVETAAF